MKRKWVKCKWTPPPSTVITAVVLRELFEVLILRLWFLSLRRGTLGALFMIPLCTSEILEVFRIISAGVNMIPLQLLSCIIHRVDWSVVSQNSKRYLIHTCEINNVKHSLFFFFLLYCHWVRLEVTVVGFFFWTLLRIATYKIVRFIKTLKAILTNLFCEFGLYKYKM